MSTRAYRKIAHKIGPTGKRHTRRVYRIDDDGYEMDAMCAEGVHSLRTRRAGTR